ncbi:MAG: hypothetical protein AAFQ45_14845 [Pseudomonadota bacterium]
MMPLSLFKRLRGFAVAAAACLALAGCYDVDVDMTFKPDGTAGTQLTIAFDKEAKEVANFARLVAQLYPQAKPLTADGLCKGAEIGAAMSGAGANAGANLSVEEGVMETRRGEQWACKFTADIGSSADLIARATQRPIPSELRAFFEVTSPAPDRLRVSLVPGKITNLKAYMREEVRSGRFPPRQRGMPQPAPDDVERFIETVGPALVALNRLSARGRVLSLRLTAPKIIETNMKTVGPNTVAFEMTWADMTKAILDKQDTGDATTYFVEFQVR